MPLRTLLLSLAVAAPAAAQEPVTASELRASVREAVLEAFEARTELPVTPPTLPDAASERARAAHDETAFGKRGAAQRAAAQERVRQAARDEARSRGLQRAREATAGNPHADRGLSTAEAARENGSTHSAAGRARAEEARGNGPVGTPGGGRRP